MYNIKVLKRHISITVTDTLQAEIKKDSVYVYHKKLKSEYVAEYQDISYLCLLGLTLCKHLHDHIYIQHYQEI